MNSCSNVDLFVKKQIKQDNTGEMGKLLTFPYIKPYIICQSQMRIKEKSAKTITMVNMKIGVKMSKKQYKTSTIIPWRNLRNNVSF